MNVEPGATTRRAAAPADVAEGADRARVPGSVSAVAGVVVFSLTFPTTAWALEGMGPWTVTTVRAVLAALIAGGCLLARRVPLPRRAHWAGLATVAGGLIVGYPLLTTLALQTTTSTHAAVIAGLLPLTTAVYGTARTGVRPPPVFWAAALTGAAVVVGFAFQQGGGTFSAADLYLFASLLVAAAAYTEGGLLARAMPGWQVIAWALVICLPLTAAGSVAALLVDHPHPTARSLIGLIWLGAGAQFLGPLVWYRGIAAIGITRASQILLSQPLLTLIWSVPMLGERPPVIAAVAAVAVLVCIAVTQRAGR
ncbi:DMT family transporter [Streptomyces sp. NBC_00669]|uniref:DMT family transporter n=1 Tax=Streptomyces sp. NBC_00669 TaxID=2976011 RepID=UPI002E31D9F6|nr:DMT family transporter [Streptomyces sp. NBC_00669]